MCKTNFNVTIGYTAVFTIDIKADDETDAKQKAYDLFDKQRGKMSKVIPVDLQDDEVKVAGCLNMDETWKKSHVRLKTIEVRNL